ncbi:MAG: hypothetical protein KAH30_06165, partial [Caldisericia bacterium]|nr:hypothetical protein [Caldisericia bacterium]
MKNIVKMLIIIALVVTTIWFVPTGAPDKVSAYIGWGGAAGSLYIGATVPQPMDINVSGNTGDSRLGYDRSLVLDSNGYPH